MTDQNKPTDPNRANEAQPPLPSVRGTGNVLGGYRAPGDEKHQQPSPQHGDQQQPDARVEQALDHDGKYDKWGGKETETGKEPSPSAPPKSGAGKSKAGGSSADGKSDLSPPTGHYGDGEMGGQGGSEPRP